MFKRIGHGVYEGEFRKDETHMVVLIPDRPMRVRKVMIDGLGWHISYVTVGNVILSDFATRPTVAFPGVNISVYLEKESHATDYKVRIEVDEYCAEHHDHRQFKCIAPPRGWPER